MHRIPAGRRTARRSGAAAKGKKTVLIMHGLLGSSGDFHGKYDAPAMIDRVLNVTGLPKLLYIGYSMGTTTFFTMMSERPEYNDKIISFLALAPAVYLDNIKSLATMLLKTSAASVLEAVGTFWENCDNRVPVSLLYGENDQLTEKSNGLWGDVKPYNLTNVRVPVSLLYGENDQLTEKSVSEHNTQQLWGDVKPYNLTNVRVPVSLLYGENDQLTEKSQIMKLAAILRKTGMLEELRPGCSWPKFNHLDFTFAKDVGNLFSKP
ncbi:Lipase 3-like protein-5, partial [Operophtera brumata]